MCAENPNLIGAAPKHFGLVPEKVCNILYIFECLSFMLMSSILSYFFLFLIHKLS